MLAITRVMTMSDIVIINLIRYRFAGLLLDKQYLLHEC